MAYLVGATTVIDNSGNIDWARLTNVPTIGDITGVTVTNGTPADLFNLQAAVGVITYSAADGFNRNPISQGGYVAATYNCYVESLSGGGTSGAVTITANRGVINCACQCRC